MDLDRLELFALVAKYASFSAAAREVGVPPSTVSRAIAALERDLDAQLFHRSTRKVVLTSVGAALLERVAPALSTLRDALAHLPTGSEPTGTLRISAPPDIGTAFLATALAAFGERHPRVTVDLWLTNRNVDIIAEGFDAVLRASIGQPRDSSLRSRRLTPVELHVYAAPGYLARTASPRWIHLRGWKPSEAANDDAAEASIGDPVVVVDDFGFVREFLKAGGGIGYLPSFLARNDLATGALERVLPERTVRGGSLLLLHSNTKHPSPPLTALKAFLADWFSDCEPDPPTAG